MRAPVLVTRGEAPVILAMPHGGTDLPPGIAERLNGDGRRLVDTDWRIERLYEGLAPGATVVRATLHRYAADANRAPTGESLYPGVNTTGTVPMTDFDGRPIWDAPPDAEEARHWIAAHHAPYHAALGAEVARLRAAHGRVLLWDCHSIRSRIPFLFEGLLPAINLGTNGGASCAASVEAGAWDLARASGFPAVRNGRFRGGWTTRHHGRPEAGVHAVQMEVAQRAYLAAEAPPWTYDPGRAEPLRAVLGAMIEAARAALPAPVREEPRR